MDEDQVASDESSESAAAEDPIIAELTGETTPADDEKATEVALDKVLNGSDADVEAKDDQAEDEVVEEDVAEEAAEDAQLQAKPGKGSRAQKRIQDLVAKTHALEAKIAEQGEIQSRQVQEALARQSALYEAQVAEQKRSADINAEQLRLLTSRAEREADAALSPMEQYKKQLLREAKEAAKADTQSGLDEVKQMLMEERQQRLSLQRQAQQRATLGKYSQLTSQAIDSVVLKDLSPEGRASLSKTGADMLLAFCAATNMEPAAAAPEFVKFLSKYHQAKLSAPKPAKSGGARLKEGQQIPPAASGGRKPATGEGGRPSWDVLKDNGYSDYLEWRKAGGPALQKRARK